MQRLAGLLQVDISNYYSWLVTYTTGDTLNTRTVRTRKTNNNIEWTLIFGSKSKLHATEPLQSDEVENNLEEELEQGEPRYEGYQGKEAKKTGILLTVQRFSNRHTYLYRNKQ